MTIITRPISALGEHELLAELAECISLEGEAKARAKPIRDELLRRQTKALHETGDMTPLEHDGWVASLKREPMSVTLLERHYGYPREELPADLFVEEVIQRLDSARVASWLIHKGHDAGPTFALEVRRKKTTKATEHAQTE